MLKTPQRTVLATVLSLSLAACGGGGGGGETPTPTPPSDRPTLAQTYTPSGRTAAGDVFVHLFEWKWADVANECENVLGPKGYKAVQISPPQEHIAGAQWWTRYQPVSYALESRSGTRAQFVDMVNRCKAAGVDVYADAVINHMSASSAGTGTGGTTYTKYNYPGLYASGDFHTACSINNYGNAANVQDCELVGLADLKTESSTVRQKIANYLISLADLGVAGFRIDATKHIQPVDLDEILKLVNNDALAKGRARPYVFAEVIGAGGEAVQPRDYYGLGYSSGGAADITEFTFRFTSHKFQQVGGNQYLAQLNPNGLSGSQFSEAAWSLMPSNKAVVFLENHDTQREDGSGIRYTDGVVHRLANIWMLAQPYGYPSIMSSYGFDRANTAGKDAGPPATAASSNCAASWPATPGVGSWICEHRDAAIANMVAFRKQVAGTAITNWWDNGANAIAFSRGGQGFVAINREGSNVQRSFQTGMAAGNYCDVTTGLKNGTVCDGNVVTVAADGTAMLNLAPNTAVAIHAGQKL